MPKSKFSERKITRRVNFLEARERILIVCEGEKTEPHYFEALRDTHKLSSVEVEVVGVARVGRSLVEYAIKKQVEAGTAQYTEIWCVFDEDSLKDGFDNAVAMIKAQNFLREAWSNEAFELWYVLHFEYLNTAVTRAAYKRRLNSLVEKVGLSKYKKNDAQMYKTLGIERTKVACRNAKKLLELYDEAMPCHERKPATMVFALVERLLSYAPDNPLGN